MATRQNTISKADDFKLMSLMMAELADAKMSIPEWTEYAKEKLGLPQLNKDHIYFRAKQLGIELPGPVRTVKVADAELERRVEVLEKQVVNDGNALASLITEFKTLKAQFEVFKLAAKHNVK